MRFTVGLSLLSCLLFYVSGEICTVNSDCTSTSCGTGSQVICQHPASDGTGIQPDGGLCTCEDSKTGECTTATDCHGDGAPNLNCQDSARHCYDNKCICDRFPIGK